MDLINYLNKKVRIELSNSYYYKGVVLSFDDKFLTIKDKFGKFVDVSIDAISLIVEVGE